MSKFINPSSVMAQTGLAAGMTVVDLGCGNGFYVLPAAQLVGNQGVVYAVDVQQSKLEATNSIANQFGYKNVRITLADLTKPLLQIPEAVANLVVIGNILHEIPDRTQLLKNAYRVMVSGGSLLVVEWKKELTPFGPPLAKRIDQQMLEVLLMQAGLQKVKELDTDGYHYAVLYKK